MRSARQLKTVLVIPDFDICGAGVRFGVKPISLGEDCAQIHVPRNLPKLRICLEYMPMTILLRGSTHYFLFKTSFPAKVSNYLRIQSGEEAIKTVGPRKYDRRAACDPRLQGS
jgi:hypothetical protein